MLSSVHFRRLALTSVLSASILWLLSSPQSQSPNVVSSAVIVAVVATAVYLATGGSYTIYLAWHTIPRDAR